MKLVDHIIRDFVAPGLTSNGYQRRGRTFRLAHDQDWAVVYIGTASGFQTDSESVFYPQIGVVIHRHRPYLSPALQAELGARLPGIENAQLAAVIEPSTASSHDRDPESWTRGQWGAHSVPDADRIGIELRHKIVEQALPWLADALQARGGTAPPAGPDLTAFTIKNPFTR